MIVPLVRTLRPKQWVKNIFVVAALVFSRHATETAYLIKTAIALAAFCLVSGAVYTFNDVRDVEADRAHPTKKNRPIAAGQLSERAALIAAGLIAAISIGACAVLSLPLAGIVAFYAAQNVAYSVKLKHVAFVDVVVVAGGFLLRVLAGAVAIDVPASGWLLACTALVASYLGLGKRAHELAWAARSGQATKTRAALAGYRYPVVKWLMFILAVATIGAYVAYTLDPHTVEFFGTNHLFWTAPLVAAGILRFLSIALWNAKPEPPTEAMLRDPWFMLDLVAVSGTVVYIIYG